jgi:DNA polymerase III delta prime subunit
MLGRLERGMPDRPLAIHGLRGVGKTVLVRQLADEARQRNWFVVHRELRRGVELRPTLAQALDAAFGEFEQETKLRKLIRRLRSVLASFSASVDSDGSIRLGVEARPAPGIANSGELEGDTVELLAEIGAAAREAGTGLLLALDELQELEERGLMALTAAIHRTTQMELPVALICAGLPNLPLRLIEAKTYAERLYAFPRLAALSESASREALRVPAEREGVDFEDAALDAIVERSEGYPYFLQEWGRAVWNAAEQNPISFEDVQRASPRVRDELDEEFFGMRLARTTSAERRYMAALAELGDGPQRSAEVARRLGKDQRLTSPQRASLIEKGLIYGPAHGEIDFTVPRYGDFMRRRWPLAALPSA